MPRRNHVWIVEGRYYDPQVAFSQLRWRTTVGCALTQEDGKKVLKDWQRRNPDDKFRLVEYLGTQAPR